MAATTTRQKIGWGGANLIAILLALIPVLWIALRLAPPQPIFCRVVVAAISVAPPFLC